jgi:predicted DNA-binding protein with PD1-like motif
MMNTFPTPAPVDLVVRNAAGTITVTAADTDTSTVEAEPIDSSGEAADLAERTTAVLTDGGKRLTVEVPERRGLLGFRPYRVAVRVTVPTGSRVSTKAASADVTCAGRFGEVTVHTASGDATVDDVDGDVELHAASGRLRLRSGGRVKAHTASGKVEVGTATGDVDVHAASGEVRIGVAEASVRVKTASGKVWIDEARQGTVDLNAASGDLRVGVRAGVVARLELNTISGRVRSELPVEDSRPEGGAPLEIRARTVSGDLLVAGAGARS